MIGSISHKPTLAILVPYRERYEHLAIFIPAMRKYLPAAKIIVIEQSEYKPFNRGKLLNIGYLEYPDFEYYALHDVDKIPWAVDYSYPNNPTQLAKNDIQKNGYFGGVTLFNNLHFRHIQGFSNNFWGWGGEDNELYNRTSNEFHYPITYRFGTFQDLPHVKSGTFNYSAFLQAKRQRKADDGLYNCKYTLNSKIEYEDYNHLIVEV